MSRGQPTVVHVTIGLAISHWIEHQTGWSIKKFVRSARRYRTVTIQVGRHIRRTIKWRTGSEGRISTLKRGYGWDRTRIDDTEGTRIWTGHGVLTHNLVKISALAA
jgi:IS5 family transposase